MRRKVEVLARIPTIGSARADSSRMQRFLDCTLVVSQELVMQVKSRTSSKSRAGATKWSAKVGRESDALDLEQGVFAKGSAKEVAQSLKRSAQHSTRRKSSPFRSAMSMLNFFINRAGRKLGADRTKTLERAKDELRKQFGRDKPDGK